MVVVGGETDRDFARPAAAVRANALRNCVIRGNRCTPGIVSYAG
jgi:hypothetical protein